MEHRASEPVHSGDDQLVAGADGRGEGLVELGPAGLGTAGMVEWLCVGVTLHRMSSLPERSLPPERVSLYSCLSPSRKTFRK